MTALDVGAAVAAARARDLDREGIPMVLALDGAAPAPAGDPRLDDGARLADLLEGVHRQLAALPPVPVSDVPGDDPSPLGAGELLLAESLATLAWAETGPGGELLDTVVAGPGGDPGSAELGDVLAALREGRFVRAVNWHNTSEATAHALRRHLERLAARFRTVDARALGELWAGRWAGPPPLLAVFYEGYRNHVEVAAPTLDAAGMTGWFFVISGFVDAPPADQRAFALAHDIALVAEEDGVERLAMTWPQVAEVAGRHVVTAHTATHARMDSVRTPEDFEREVVGAAAAVAAATGSPVTAHAWLYGTGSGVSREHDTALRNAGNRWCFANTAIGGLGTATEVG